MGFSKAELTQLKKERIGQKRINNQGLEMECIGYNSASNITVKFYDPEYIAEKRIWKDFNKGTIKNLNFPDVFGVGVIGNKYPSRKNGKKTKEYICWVSMLRRCYEKEYKERNITYTGVQCCEEWLYFPNFHDWLHSQENFEKWYNENQWAVDKDILYKGNKIYSPETCCLVPKVINSLFTKRDKERGGYPIGVSYHKKNNMYYAYCHDNGSVHHLGYFITPEKAFMEYKKCKEKVIKNIAKDEYIQGNITKRCYEAMMNYKVEITD